MQVERELFALLVLESERRMFYLRHDPKRMQYLGPDNKNGAGIQGMPFIFGAGKDAVKPGVDIGNAQTADPHDPGAECLFIGWVATENPQISSEPVNSYRIALEGCWEMNIGVRVAYHRRNFHHADYDLIVAKRRDRRIKLGLRAVELLFRRCVIEILVPLG